MERREFFKGMASASVLIAMQSPSSVAAGLRLAADRAAVQSTGLMWAVGTSEDFNWQAIRAETIEAARHAFASKSGFLNEKDAPYDCVEARRCETWDGIDGKPTPADWIRASLSHVCSRCSIEASGDEAHAMGDEAVCEDCMTLDDWRIADPCYAADLMEQMEAD
jgi:hypothetical protein